MEPDTTNEGDLPEDNEVIRKLRGDLKASLAKNKTAGADAIALVERGTKAAGLMPEGFKGFADVFANEVDGELTEESAVLWLAGRGFTAPSDEKDAEQAAKAAALEDVTDLGSAVAAAGNLTPEDTVASQLGEVIKTGEPQTLQEVTAAIERIIHG